MGHGTESDGEGDEDEEVVEREFTVEVNGKRFEVDLEERGAPPINVGNVAPTVGASHSGHRVAVALTAEAAVPPPPRVSRLPPRCRVLFSRSTSRKATKSTPAT